MFERNYFLAVFLASFLILTSFVSAVSVNVTTEPTQANYYSDTKDVNLVFGFEDLTIWTLQNKTTYTFTVTNPNFSFFDCWSDPGKITCDPSIFQLKANETSGTIKYVFSLKSPNTRTEDEFNWELKKSGCPPGDDSCKWSGIEPFSVDSGAPQFTLSLIDLNKNQAGTEFGKNNTVQVKLKDIWDNENDKFGNQIYCEYYIDNVLQTSNSGTTSNETLSELILGNFDTKNKNAAEHTLKVICKDGQQNCVPNTNCLKTEDTKKFTIIDKPPKVDSITFSPEKIYPDTKVTCNAIINDEDDPTSLDKTFAWKFKGQSIANTTNQFDCTTNKCVSGDTLTCIVTPKNNQTGQSATKETTVQSYFSTVKISAPSKVQVSQEATFTADVTYTGKGTVTYSWAFGDGSSGTGKSVKKTYTTKGEFTVTLTVTDGKNSSGEATTTVSVVDADLIISIKSPVTNQEVVKGETLNIKVGLNDNTGTPITDANVTALIKSGDKNFGIVATLKAISGTPGLYEADMKIGYLIPTQSEIEISANYNKGTVKMFNKKSVPISLTPFDNVLPTFEMETQYEEQNETELTVGNTIEKLLVCFALPAGFGFDDALIATAKLQIESSTTTVYDLIEKENNCYVLFPEYKVSKGDLDTGIVMKFKDAKDIYGNYVKTSFAKTYTVKKGKDVFDAVLLEPNSDKINIGEKVSIKIKVTPTAETKLNEIKNIVATVTYLDKTIKLTSIATTSNSNEKTFSGEFLPDYSLKEIKFKTLVSGEYKGSVVEQELKTTLATTTALNAEMISPNENGVFDTFGKIILNIKYEDGKAYDGNSLAVNINDENVVFLKNEDGFFEAENDEIGIFSSANFNFKGADAKGNLLNYSATIPTMAWGFPMFVYYILGAALLVLIVVVVLGKKLSAKSSEISAQTHALSVQVKEKSIAERLEELESQLKAAKDGFISLRQEHFKLATPEEEYGKLRRDAEAKIRGINEKIVALKYQQNNNLKKTEAEVYVANLAEKKREELNQGLNKTCENYGVSSEHKAILEYQLKRKAILKYGSSPEKVREELKGLGWQDNEINIAIKKIFED